MNYDTTQPCPNNKCNNLQAVHLTLEEMPAAGEWFTYICPKCKRQVIFRIGAIAVGAEIPSGATIATPYAPGPRATAGMG